MWKHYFRSWTNIWIHIPQWWQNQNVCFIQLLEFCMNKISLSWCTGMFPRKFPQLTVILLSALVCQGNWDSALLMVLPLQDSMTPGTVCTDMSVFAKPEFELISFELQIPPILRWHMFLLEQESAKTPYSGWARWHVWDPLFELSIRVCITTGSLGSKVGHLKAGIFLGAEIIIWLSQPMNHSSERTMWWEIIQIHI